MYTELFSRANHQLEDMLMPARKLQGAMVDHMAKVTDFQLGTLRSYSELGMKELRALQDVNDPQSLQNFMAQHAEMMRTVSEKMSRDMNELVRLQRHFAEDLQQVSREGASNAVQAAQSTGQEASRATDQMARQGAEATREAAEKASSAASNSSASSTRSGSEQAPRAEPDTNKGQKSGSETASSSGQSASSSSSGSKSDSASPSTSSGSKSESASASPSSSGSKSESAQKAESGAGKGSRPSSESGKRTA